MKQRIHHITSFTVFILLIFLANWAIVTFGIIPIGFGLQAPAGVLFVGASFLTRDWLQHSGGNRSVFLAIFIGTGLSAYLSPNVAVASALGFLSSESLDFLVYSLIQRHGKPWTAVVFSNVCGSIVDSVVFLTLAFGSLTFLPGQVIGKLWITLTAVLILYTKRQYHDRVLRHTGR